MNLLKIIQSFLKPQKALYPKNRRSKGKMLEIETQQEITIPQLPKVKEPLKIKEWHFKVGDFIYEGETLCTLESEKLQLEFEVAIGGKLTYLNSKKGYLATGEKIAIITGMSPGTTTPTSQYFV